MTGPAKWPAAALALATIAASIAVGFGAPTWIIMVVAALPWMPVLVSRLGGATGVAVLIVLELWLLLAQLMTTAALQLPMVPSVIVTLGLLGLVGSAILYRSAETGGRPTSAGVTVVAGSLVGGLVWLVTQGLAAVIPGATRVSWIMRGDSANNMLFARQIVYDSGIHIGATENPVPLPAALMAVVMDAGRSGIAPEDLAGHDLGSFTQVWSIGIIITCVLAGLAAGAIAQQATSSRATLAVASVVGSLIPVSWIVTGYALDFGFFGTHVALPIVFTAVILFITSERRPAVAMAMLTVTATLLLAVWSPLVMIPAALGAVMLVRSRRELLATRGRSLAVLLIGFTQLLAYGFGVVMPVFIVNATFLDAGGGVIVFPRLAQVIGLLVVALVATAVLAYPARRHLVPVAVIAVVLALAAAVGGLLFISRDSPDPWGYYPMKLAWMSSTILVVLLVGTAAAALHRLSSRPWLQRSGLAVIAVGLTAVLAYTPTASATPHLNPVVQVLSGTSLGPADIVAERVIELADSERSHFLWNSGSEYEQQINLWVMQLWADTLVGNLELRTAAYGYYDHTDIDELCRIVGLLGGDTVVHTAETDLASRVAVACPGEGITIEQE